MKKLIIVGVLGIVASVSFYLYNANAEENAQHYDIAYDYNDLSVDEKFLGVYLGEYENLSGIYSEEESQQIKDNIELAVYNKDIYSYVFSENSEHKPKIYYSESYFNFEFKEITDKIIKSRAGQYNLAEVGFEKVEPNYTLEEYQNFIQELDIDEPNVNSEQDAKIYEIDLNNDGNLDIIFTGTFKISDFFEVYLLDENKNIMETIETREEYDIGLYKYMETYMFISDFNVIIFDKDKQYTIEIDKQNIGPEIVISNPYSSEYGYTDYIYDFKEIISSLNPHNVSAIGEEIIETEEIVDKFAFDDSRVETCYGTVDANNDGVLDYTKVKKEGGYGRDYNGFISVEFVDGKTNEPMELGFSDYENLDLQGVKVEKFGDVNYFLAVYSTRPVDENYIFKLFAIKNNKTELMQDWIISSKNNILVDLVVE